MHKGGLAGATNVHEGNGGLAPPRCARGVGANEAHEGGANEALPSLICMLYNKARSFI